MKTRVAFKWANVYNENMENYIVAVLGDCDLYVDEIADNSIAVLDKKYLEGKVYRAVSCDNARYYHKFYEGLRNGKKYKFKSPTKIDYDEFFDALIMSGKENILYLANSTFFDDDYYLAKKASADSMLKFPKSQILVLNSKGIGMQTGIWALKACENRFTLSCAEEYVRLKSEIENDCLFTIVYDCDEFAKNALLPSQSIIGGSLVGVKPVITVDSEGKCALFRRCKSERTAVTTILRYAKENGAYKNSFYVYSADSIRNELFAIAMIQDAFPGSRIRVGKAGQSAGATFAPGALFIGFSAKRVQSKTKKKKGRVYNDRISVE